MCIAVVGNEDVAGKRWVAAAAHAGFDLRLVQPPLLSVISGMDGLDAVVIMSDAVTSEEQEEAVQIAACKGIPSLCARCEGAVFCR